jgi:hypothetical protein
MPQGLKSTVRLFADDPIVYLTITCENDALALQTDLNKLGIWEKKWKMESHPNNKQETKSNQIQLHKNTP